MKKGEIIRDKKIVISTHVYTTGPAQDLREYLLKKKISKLLFLGHPLFYDKSLKDSGYELYMDRVCRKKVYSDIRKRNPFISYARSFLLNIFWVIVTGPKYDLYVGCNNLNALAGVFLRKLGFVKRVVYYVIDYNPRRFPNPIVNYLYHLVDRVCVRYSDETWNLSARMSEARKKYFNFSCGSQRTVPVGVWVKRIKKPKDFEHIDKHTLVYMGHVVKSKGVQYVLKAIPSIAKNFPDFKFGIIGKGDYEGELKRLVKELKIGKYVDFMGYIESHEEVENLMSTFSGAVALYEKYVDGNLTFTYFADPAKIKNYLACGLPVLLTDVPHSARDIEKNKCGLIIDLEEECIANAVIRLMGNSENLKNYRKNAVKYSKKFDWDKIFESNINRVLGMETAAVAPTMSEDKSSIKNLSHLLRSYGPKKILVYAFYEGRRRFFYQMFRKSFSQNKEDLIIDKLLNFKRKGFYVDVGAYDPNRFSNTKRFYQRGWRGINIEPDLENYKKFETARPLDINVNVGIGSREGTMTFYKMFPATLSTFSERSAKSYEKSGYEISQKIPVAVKTLAGVLDKYSPKKKIDFLSVDTEGFDLEVLESNNWEKYKPKIICVESSLPGSGITASCENFLKKVGYRKILDNGINSLFIL